MAATVCSIAKASVFLPGDLERRLVLQDISWDIGQGEHTVLVGANGAGKTTTLRLMRGEVWTCQGSVSWLSREGVLEDSRITGLAVTALVSPDQQRLFQRQAWDITGRELLLAGFDGTPLLYTPKDREKQARVEEVAETLGCVSLLDRSVLTLSQGQLRILLLGRALIPRPTLLLLDECTDGLDARHRELFDQALEKARFESTAVMATHRESRIPSWVKRRKYISKGRISDEPFDADGAAGTGTVGQGGAVRHEIFSCAGAGEPLLEVANADVYLDGEKVLWDLNWKLYPGERWHLQGANGAGKSTFLRLLAGEEHAAWPGTARCFLPARDAGEIPLQTLRRHVRLVSDLSQAFYEYDLTCLELVLSGFDNTIGLYREYLEAERERARQELAFLGLSRLADTPVSRISTGQERRLFLARALMGSPSVLLLDEPCTGLDEASRDAYVQALDQLAEEGMQYVFVSHYEEDVPASVNRIALMQDGRLQVLR
ncbi:MAG: ATP-binding cassette domain-containing protein [Desulfovibrio sp.]|nr:ATP-binding cassette domain-containing protein [Desulfovibrio sp.]